MKTIKRGRGEILLERRPTKDFNLSNYGPCPYCLLWVAKALLKKHHKSCVGRDTGQNETIGTLVTHSDSISGRIQPIASERLIKETFSIMNKDEIGKVAQSDTFIIQLGNQWMEKNIGNKLKRGVYTSQIMRLCGRFLLNMRKLKPLKDHADLEKDAMWDYLKPMHFEYLVQAALLTCSPKLDKEENLSAPSNALKLGHDLKRMCNGKIGLAIIHDDKKSREQAADVLQLMQVYWVTRITKAVRVMLVARRDDVDKRLPDPEDIRDINRSLNAKIEALDLQHGRSNYRHVAQVLQAKLVLYNRRRSEELQAITLRDYSRRSRGVAGKLLVRNCTAFEKKLLENQEVMSIRGKHGRRVPVLIPKEVQPGLAYLTDTGVRTAAGIGESNPYLFASKKESIVWAYDSLNKAGEEASLKAPELITSTNLRKYMATMTQVLDLKSNEFEWVLNHLGHTMDVHKLHYRATSDILERTQNAKLLMLQYQGRIGEFQNQSLEEIQFEDVVQEDTEETDPDEGQVDTEEDSYLEEALDESQTFFSELEGKSRNPKASETGNNWSADEEEEIKALFKKFFDLKKRPTPADCLKAKKRSKRENGFIMKERRMY
ncbi:hypothetical protein DPMN_189384 [Dreissena polymorpha]|uniref:Uncharacterized protein n=1 Tax=Dreissena polymorpha TaxID=45954 RepID=A0A9D4ICA3_DREPO|nr:hypothetical protein DPMN_189384 [Dreissena polymorpha]